MTAFVLVHGMGHGAWCWEGTIAALERRGHQVFAPDLPLTSLVEDAAVVTEALERARQRAVLVGHSYGGLVVSRAASAASNVGHLVYVAALLLDADDLPGERAAPYPPTELAQRWVVDDSGRITVDPASAVACFYGLCDPAVAKAAAARLRPTALRCLQEPVGVEPWRSIPSTYLVCRHDRAVHPDQQWSMAARAGAVVALDADHSPFLSAPAPLVDVLDHVASSVGSQV